MLTSTTFCSALRRATTLIVLIGEYFILGKVVASDETWSVVLMVGGALIAGAGDLSWSFMGYLLIGLNCVVTAGYLVYIKRTSQDTRLDSLTLMLYNNLLSIPVVLVVVFMTEWDSIINYPLWWDPGFLVRTQQPLRYSVSALSEFMKPETKTYLTFLHLFVFSFFFIRM